MTRATVLLAADPGLDRIASVKRVAGNELVPAIHAALRGVRRVAGVPGRNDDGTPTAR